jgi:alanine-synthesizing transaminase
VRIKQSSKLAGVCYDIRGPVLARAKALEAAGQEILKLNIGNPAAFGFEAPDEVRNAVIENLGRAAGYSDSRGIPAARDAVAAHYRSVGLTDVTPDDVYLGNGVSELIQISLQAMLDGGDEVLIPSPDYPLWTAAVSLCGARPVHYKCDESNGWAPDLEDLRSKVTDRTAAVVVINPNNPTGAVYSREVLTGITGIAREHGLVVMADEIYDRILYDGAEHINIAVLAPDVLTLTFSGLSKAYLAAGYRAGWMVITGPREEAGEYLDGLEILTNMRLCANHPSQHAIAAALAGPQSIQQLVLPSGRLGAQRDQALTSLAAIPGVSCVRPQGALYVFPRLDPEVHKIVDDQRLVLDLLEREHVLLVQGTGFNLATTDHLRIVTLPAVDVLDEAIGRFGRFLGDYYQ